MPVWGLTPEQAKEDDRQWRFLQCSSGLQCLIGIRPPNSNDASIKTNTDTVAFVAASVAAGSFLDPPDALGLAHLVEHLVFLGSKRYKGSNDWEKFLSRHGGESNASTQELSTLYHFTVSDGHLSEALERFSDLLFHPVLSSKMLKKEIQAVDAEFQLGKHNDAVRVIEVQRYTSKEEHPFSRFCWGNLESLVPSEKLAQQAKKFHQSYYHKDKARLVVYIPNTDKWNLDDLQQMVLDKFAEEPGTISVNNGMESPSPTPSSGSGLSDSENTQPPTNSSKKKKKRKQQTTSKIHVDILDEEKLSSIHSDTNFLKYPLFGFPFDLSSCNFCRIVPNQEKYSAQFTFQLPSMDEHYRSMPTEILGEMLGHESKGSLLSLLRKEGLAHSIIVGCGGEEASRNPSFWLFSVELDLTKKGASQLGLVFALTFQCISLIRSSDPEEYRRVFQEMKSIAEYNFRFTEDDDPLDLVEDLALRMLNPHIQPRSLLIATELFLNYDFKVVFEVLGYLSPENCRIDILCPAEWQIDGLSQNLDSSWQTDPWFGIKFLKSTIPFQWKEDAMKSPIYEELFLMRPNFLLPKDVSVKEFNTPTSSIEEIHKSPDGSSIFWYKHDVSLKSPRGNVYLLISNPTQDSNDLSMSLATRFWAELLQDDVTELCYTASAGGMFMSLSMTQFPMGLMFAFTGFESRLFEFVELVLNRTMTLCERLKNLENRFLDIKESVLLGLETRTLDPSQYGYHIIQLFLLSRAHDTPEAIESVKEISLTDVSSQITTFFNDVSILGLLHGNLTKIECQSLVDNTLSHIDHPLKDGYLKTFPHERVIDLDYKQEVYIQLEGRNATNSNSSIMNYYQVGHDSIKQRVKLKLLESLLQEPCFDVLRTEQQLGYSVSCHMSNMEGILGFEFNIVSADYDPAILDDRIEKFIREEFQNLQEMPKDEFKETVEGLISDLQTQDLSISDIGTRLWHEIEDHTMVFDRIDREVEILRSIKLQEVIKLYDRILFNTETRRKLSVQICGSSKMPEFGLQSEKMYSGKENLKFLRTHEEIIKYRHERPLLPVKLEDPNILISKAKH